MAYNLVSLVLDLADGTGALIGQGSCKLAPSAQLTDASDNLLVIESPVWTDLSPVASPKLSLLATDNANLLPSGWAWTISFPGVPGNPSGYNFFLPAAPQTFTATNASPCVFTGSGSGYLNNTGVQLSGLSLPAGFSAGTVYWTVNASGSTFELAATAGGTPIASTSTGSGSVIAVSSYLSSLSPVSSVTTMAAYMPLPSGTASSGQVPVATGSGETSAWGTVAIGNGGTGQVTAAAAYNALSPMTTLGDIEYETAAPSAARLAGNASAQIKFLSQTGTGSASAAPVWSVVSGQYLCAPSVYAPSVAVDLVVSTTTLAAFNVAATTVASGSNGGEISTIASWSSPSSGVLDVASTTGYPSAGTLTVATSTTTATITYTGTSGGNSFTGCAYVSGSATGTVSTGGAVTLTGVTLQTNSFTAPASGTVVVGLNCAVEIATGGDKTTLGLAAAGTVTPVFGYVICDLQSSTSSLWTKKFEFVVTGLAAGTSYQFQLVGATGAATSTIIAFGNTSTSQGNAGAPVVMTVQAV